MIDLIKYSCIYFLIGFLPIFFFLAKKEANIYLNLIISVAFSPVLIAILNSVNVVLNFQGSYLQFLTPLLLIILVSFINPFWRKFYTIEDIKLSVKPLIYGILFGSVYWYVFFYQFYMEGRIYADVVWNLGIVGELKNHFPPTYPVWKTDGVFIYHYLANMGFAGISNFAGLNIVKTVLKCGYLINSIAIFTIMSLTIRKRFFESLVLFVLIFFFSLCSKWQVYSSLGGHMTGSAASTFFWSLPLLLASVYLIIKINEEREEDRLPIKTSFYYFIIVSITGFSKISNLMVLIGLELGFFLVYFFKNRIYEFDQLKKHRKTVAGFLQIPIFSLFMFFIFSSKNSYGLVPGIEARDFLAFESWNPIYPFIGIYGPLLVLLIIKRNELNKFKWEFIVCSILNLLFYFFVRHVGGSDLYFAFNALICNMLFLAYSSLKELLKQYVYSYLLCAFFVLIFQDLGYFKGFTPLEFNLKNFRISGDSRYIYPQKEIEEFISLSNEIPNQALIAVPKQDAEDSFCFSGFIGKRIWNENSRSPSVNNYWTLAAKFISQQGFIPDYITKTPKQEDFEAGYSKFIRSLKPEVLNNLEDEDRRFSIYRKCVFEEIPFQDCEKIVKENKWSHIIVMDRDMKRINSWLKSKVSIEGKFITVFVVST